MDVVSSGGANGIAGPVRVTDAASAEWFVSGVAPPSVDSRLRSARVRRSEGHSVRLNAAGLVSP